MVMQNLILNVCIQNAWLYCEYSPSMKLVHTEMDQVGQKQKWVPWFPIWEMEFPVPGVTMSRAAQLALGTDNQSAPGLGTRLRQM